MAGIYKYWFVLIIVLLGCQQKQDSEAAVSEENMELRRLENEVKEIHDQAMMNIEPSMSLKSQLKESIALLKEDPAQVDEVILRELLVKNLDDAQKNMMDWMRSYNESMAIEDPTEKLAVMEKEKTSIIEVETQMRSAVGAAEAALNAE